MNKKLIILFSLTSLTIRMSPQETPRAANCFGERVIQDYLSFYKTQQTANQKLFSATHLWFDDTDTHQMAASFLNFHADSINGDTIFFIHERCVAWGETNSLEIISGDTLFGLMVKWLEGGYRSFEAYKTPFLNVYSKTYWEDICKWDTTHISKPTEYVVLDGSHFYLVRLIYHYGQLISTEFCHHGYKYEYINVEWHDSEKDVRLSYPKDKRWQKIF